MLPTLTDDFLVHNAKPCIKSSQSSCCDPVIKRPRKCLRKSTIVKNRNAVNYVSESVNNVVNCSRSFSTSSSGFVCQPVRFNKSVHKHISSSVVNKPTTSVDASETFKRKYKFYDVWIQFLILFLLVTLNYGYLSFKIDCYNLKANTIVNNLTACLIFIK